VLSEKLLDAVYCPICGSKLHVEEINDDNSTGVQRRLLCDRHGEMNAYLDRNPKVAKLDLGVEDLEAP
jgi:uncharacterized protein YbaR (Trm112 family)